ncbi:MAG: hypothetical protein M9947_14665 [Thermomicrobiales bacterium]|nr:hypothetical protein [Thermomicrobiales bacterium]
MLRRFMVGMLTLMLVATLVLSTASVGAQEEEIGASQAPVVTEETIPEREPPPVEEVPPVVKPQPEPPVVEGQTEAPVAEQPAIEAPMTDEATVDEPAAEQPASEDPVVENQTDEPAPADDGEPEEVNENDDGDSEEPQGIDPVISGFSADCSGNITFTIEVAGDIDLIIYAYQPGLPGHVDPSIDDRVVDGSTVGPVSVTLDYSRRAYTAGRWVIVTLTGTKQLALSSQDCGFSYPDDEEPNTPTVISSTSLACDGALTFTITEAADEELYIQFTNPYTPLEHRELGGVSFMVTGTGIFQVSIEVNPAIDDVIDAYIHSPVAGSIIGKATVYGCVDGEEWASGDIELSLTCDGIVTYTGEWPSNWAIRLYDASTNPHTQLSIMWFSSDETSGTFDSYIPAGVYDSLVARASGGWEPLGIAYATDCLDDEPQPTVDTQVENLSITCHGLVTFDLETSEPVELGIHIFVPAAAPGYNDSTQITAGNGPQHVQFTLPASQSNEWGVWVEDATQQLGHAYVQGCLTPAANTPAGSDVTVPVAGGSVTFENVVVPGETYVTQLNPAFAPPLPAQYQGQLVIMVDITTTAVIDGAAEVCLPIVGDVAENAANVRLLHYENGSWVDITTSAGNGQVCGVTSSFSPFAIVKLMGQEPSGPGKPGGPKPAPSAPETPGHTSKPGHLPNRPPATGSSTGGASNPTNLPNTGISVPAEREGASTTLPLLLSLMALGAAVALHTPQRPRSRHRP